MTDTAPTPIRTNRMAGSLSVSRGLAVCRTRHPRARDWAVHEGIAVDTLTDHLEVDRTNPGYVLIGSLPVNLAAGVCARGGRYRHRSLDVPPPLRGRELGDADMRRLGGWIEELNVTRAG